MGVDEDNSTEFEEGERVGLPIAYNPSGKYQLSMLLVKQETGIILSVNPMNYIS